MDEQSPQVVQFTLNGSYYELSREQVEARLAGVVPEKIYTHSVQVNRSWFSVMQAFEGALGIPRAAFNSHTARRHLAHRPAPPHEPRFRGTRRGRHALEHIGGWKAVWAGMVR